MLGGGFAGAYVARLLGKQGATIVSRQNSMLYTPLLPEAASGTLEPRHVVVPLRQMCPHAELVARSRVSLDTEQRTVAVESDRRAARDRVRAPRRRARRRQPRLSRARPRRARHAGSRTSPTRSRCATTSSSGSMPRPPDGPAGELGFVFVGAGYAGVEALGGAERSRPGARSASTRRCATSRSAGCSSTRRRRSCPRSRGGSGAYAAKRLERRGIEIRVGDDARRRYDGATAVLSDGTAIAGAHARLDGRRQGEPAPRRARPPARRARPRAGRRAPAGRGARRASGRSATAPPSRTRRRRARPIRRPASTRSGRRDGSRRTSRASRSPTRYRMLGQVATLGRYKGIADVMGLRIARLPRLVRRADVPPLRSCRSSSRKLRVVADWTIALFFRRDIAELSSARASGGPRATDRHRRPPARPR